MPGPDVQQLPGGGGLTSYFFHIFFLYQSIVFCLGSSILPYALSFYWHFVLRPLHLILFFRCSSLARDEDCHYTSSCFSFHFPFLAL